MNDILSELKLTLPFDAIFATREIDELSLDLANGLSAEEQAELSSFSNEKRKQEFVTSRLLLREMAGQLDPHLQNFRIYKNELGNPFSEADGKTYEVSIAHTKYNVFCGLSRTRAIGIDMEPAGRKVTNRLRSRMMHPAEKERDASVSTIRLWTVKEAYIKLRGQGLRLNMNEVNVKREGDRLFAAFDNEKKAKICSFQYQNQWLAIAYYLET